MDHRNQISRRVVNGIAQTTDGYLWIGTDRGLIRFDGFNFRPVSLTSIAIASSVSILQLLTMLAENCGSVHRAPISYAKKMASLRASDTVKRNHRPVKRQPRRSTGFPDIEQGTFRFVADSVQKLGPASPPVNLSGRNSRRQDLAGHTRRWPLFSCGGRCFPGQRRIAQRKINCLLAIGSDRVVGRHRQGLVSRKTARLSSG